MNVRRGMSCAVIAALATATAVVGTAHAQEADDPIPAWIQTVFIYYANGEITGAELISALEYLIAQNIIQVATDAPAERAASEREPYAEAAAAELRQAAAAERDVAEARKAADDAIIEAAKLSETANRDRAEAARAEANIGKGTSPSAIRDNDRKAEQSADRAAESARAASKAIAAAAEAARAAAESARAADINTAFADDRARMAAAIHAAAGTTASIDDIRDEVRGNTEHVRIFKENAPQTDREYIEAINAYTDIALDGANAAYNRAALTTYNGAVRAANDVIDDANAAAIAEAEGIDPHTPDGIDYSIGPGLQISTLADSAERAADSAERAADSAERAAVAAAHYADASAALVELADAILDDNAARSMITNIFTAIDKGNRILTDLNR